MWVFMFPVDSIAQLLDYVYYVYYEINNFYLHYWIRGPQVYQYTTVTCYPL